MELEAGQARLEQNRERDRQRRATESVAAEIPHERETRLQIGIRDRLAAKTSQEREAWLQYRRDGLR